ncbi:dTDP-4-dehydrorhamnose 3,5-epimerase [Verrucomicrobiota bacterium]
MDIHPTSIPEVKVVVPRVFEDDRGLFSETYHAERYAALREGGPFVQDNRSRSRNRVLRGLHYQLRHAQDKLVYVVRGAVFDVAVDIRIGSPTFGQWTGAVLSDENSRQMYIPRGFAHGFCVLSDIADVLYKCTDFYAPDDDHGVLWSDPAIGIDWPVKNPVVSAKDAAHSPLSGIPGELLPRHASA